MSVEKKLTRGERVKIAADKFTEQWRQKSIEKQKKLRAIENAKNHVSRKFDSTKLNYIANSLKETADRMRYKGDMTDLGNEIGFTVGETYNNMTEEDIKEFIMGFKHGVSLTNGTHG